MFEARCPICERVMTGKHAAEFPYLPFCSERCRKIDLGRWLGEKYRVAGPDGGDDSDGDDSDLPHPTDP